MSVCWQLGSDEAQIWELSVTIGLKKKKSQKFHKLENKWTRPQRRMFHLQIRAPVTGNSEILQFTRSFFPSRELGIWKVTSWESPVPPPYRFFICKFEVFSVAPPDVSFPSVLAPQRNVGVPSPGLFPCGSFVLCQFVFLWFRVEVEPVLIETQTPPQTPPDSQLPFKTFQKDPRAASCVDPCVFKQPDCTQHASGPHFCLTYIL